MNFNFIRFQIYDSNTKFVIISTISENNNEESDIIVIPTIIQLKICLKI